MIVNTYDELTQIECMSNVRGIYVKNPHELNFSFYFSGKKGDHEIRVKPLFNNRRMISSKAGTLMLHSDWKFIPGKDDKKVDSKDIEAMKEFFRKYLVFFCMVWDEQLPDPELADYFEGRVDLFELLEQFEDYDKIKDFVEKKKEDNSPDSEIIKELTDYCKKNKLVNFRNN